MTIFLDKIKDLLTVQKNIIISDITPVIHVAHITNNGYLHLGIEFHEELQVRMLYHGFKPNNVWQLSLTGLFDEHENIITYISEHYLTIQVTNNRWYQLDLFTDNEVSDYSLTIESIEFSKVVKSLLQLSEEKTIHLRVRIGESNWSEIVKFDVSKI
jgi:hypothetical protein